MMGCAKNFPMECFYLFDAQAVLFTFRILSAPFMKPVGHKRSYPHVWVVSWIFEITTVEFGSHSKRWVGDALFCAQRVLKKSINQSDKHQVGSNWAWCQKPWHPYTHRLSLPSNFVFTELFRFNLPEQEQIFSFSFFSLSDHITLLFSAIGEIVCM